MGERLGEVLDMKEEVIQKACCLAMKAHKSEKQWLSEEVAGSSEVVVAFAGSWSVAEWFSRENYGETKINLDLFPSLKRIRSSNKPAIVNEAFLRRFLVILETCLSKKTTSVFKKTPSFQEKVEKAVSKKQKIVFAGHSSGGPVAIFATLWFLEKYKSRADGNQSAPCCVTFGSPLVGDRILTHALRRENWARHFVHFVTKYDIVPRLTLAPLSSIGPEALQKILHFFDPKSPYYHQHESILKSYEVLISVMAIIRNASAVASHDACHFMGHVNVSSLLTTISSFHQVSPYRPFGTFIFCAGNDKLVVVKNPDAVLRIMVDCSRLANEAEVAHKSLSSHIGYEMELEGSLQMQTVAYLDSIKEFQLSSPGTDLGLSLTAVLCILAAEEQEKRKLVNQKEIDSTKKKIEEKLREIQSYQTESAKRRLGYYDAFKLQNTKSDFKANVNRLELAKIWDVITEMLKNQDLPDEFESREDWIKLGTEFRRLVEPLDIANYYRHSKNNETESYLGSRGRPTRYKYTQRWLEHSRMPSKLSSGSCFWAKIEELRRRGFEDAEEEIVKIETDVLDWVSDEELGKDVFLEGSTFAKWWNTLPEQHRIASVLREHMSKY